MGHKTKSLTFNCTFDQVFEALEKVGVYYRLNGYKAEVSKTSGNAIFISEEPEVKVEINIHKKDENSVLMSISCINELVDGWLEGINNEASEQIIDSTFVATRNIIDNKSSLDKDLENVSIPHLLNKKKVANKILNRLVLIIFMPILLGAIGYMLYQIYFK